MYLSYNSIFALYQSKDISLNVSSAVKEWYSGSLSNYGFILKQPNSHEFVNNSEYPKYSLIYPPGSML